MKKILIISLLLIFCFSINARGIPTTGTFTPIAPPNQVPNAPIPTPADNSSVPETSLLLLKVFVSDNDNDTLNVSFYWPDGALMGTSLNNANNSYATISIAVIPGDRYRWYVVVSDGIGETRGPVTGNWTFTVKEEEPEPEVPAKLSILCIDNRGIPISAVQIDLYDDLKYIASDFTDVNGEVEFNLVLPPYVTVKAMKQGYEPYERTIYISQSTAVVIQMYKLIDVQLIIFLTFICSSVGLAGVIYYHAQQKKGKKIKTTKIPRSKKKIKIKIIEKLKEKLKSLRIRKKKHK